MLGNDASAPPSAPVVAPGVDDRVSMLDLGAQRQRLDGRIDQAIAKVLDHGQFILGPEVAELEERLAEFCGAGHAVSCASGSDALVLALMARKVGPGDAVFVPSFTFAATAGMVAVLGAVPFFVDVEDQYFCIDPSSLDDAIDAAVHLGLTPRGVIAVDLFGHPADYEGIGPLTAGRGLWVLCDAAQSFGATLNERSTGTWGSATTTSFFPAKPLGCYGDGGAVFTDDGSDAEVMRSLRVHGQGADRYDNVRVGINGRLDTIQAAVLLEKLSIFPAEIRERQRLAARYSAALSGLVHTPGVRSGATSAWAQYTVRVPNRDQVRDALGAEAVPTAVYYPTPLHRQPAYRHYPTAPAGLPVSDLLSTDVVSLPLHPYLTDAAQDRVIDALQRVVRRRPGSSRQADRTHS